MTLFDMPKGTAGELLRILVDAYGNNLAVVSEMSGVSRSTLQRWQDLPEAPLRRPMKQRFHAALESGKIEPEPEDEALVNLPQRRRGDAHILELVKTLKELRASMDAMRADHRDIIEEIRMVRGSPHSEARRKAR